MRFDGARTARALAFATLATISGVCDVPGNRQYAYTNVAEAATSCGYTSIDGLRADGRLHHLTYENARFPGVVTNFSPAFAFGIGESGFNKRNTLSDASRISIAFEKPAVVKDDRDQTIVIESDLSRDPSYEINSQYLAIVFTQAYKIDANINGKIKVKFEDLGYGLAQEIGTYDISTSDEGLVLLPKRGFKLRLSIEGDINGVLVHFVMKNFLTPQAYEDYVKRQVDNKAALSFLNLRSLSQSNCQASAPRGYSQTLIGMALKGQFRN